MGFFSGKVKQVWHNQFHYDIEQTRDVSRLGHVS